MTEQKSPLAEAIEAARRDKPGRRFEVAGIFGLGKKPITAVHLRVPTNAQKERAVIAAHRHLEAASKGVDGAATDEDVLGDAKARELLQLVTTDAEDRLQAFFGGKWMADNLTDDQIAQLTHLLNEVRRHEGPLIWDFEDQRVEAIVTMCVRAAGTDIPERVLTPYAREYLSSLVVLLSLKLYAARRKSGVRVERDEATGDPVLVWDEGVEPDFQQLTPEALADEEMLETIVDAAPTEDEGD